MFDVGVCDLSLFDVIVPARGQGLVILFKIFLYITGRITKELTLIILNPLGQLLINLSSFLPYFIRFTLSLKEASFCYLHFSICSLSIRKKNKQAKSIKRKTQKAAALI